MSDLLQVYNYMKQYVIEKGYKSDLEGYQNIPPLEQMSKWYFFYQYAWVVINSGMKNQIAEKIFEKFWNKGDINFDAIRHKHKNFSLRKVYNKLDKIFNQYKNSKDKLKFLESLPHIGIKTKYHLAKNLGFDYAKPDRHLTRIASFFNYDNVQEFCNVVSQLSNDEIKIVDTVFWRFANLNNNYLEILRCKRI